jgi:PqqD family protein of HPr-rel-A system
MQKLAQLAINAEGFVFNPATGDSFQVSPTGLDVIQWLRDGRTDDEIARKLSDTYEVAPEDARRDLADFRGSLKALGLI